MPNLKSAKKRVRIEAKRRARNHSIKSATRTYVTKARNAIAASAAAPETDEAVREAIRQLDKAVSKGVIHRNNAARRKSRLMDRLHKTAVAQAAPAKKETGAKVRTARVARPKASPKPKPEAKAETTVETTVETTTEAPAETAAPTPKRATRSRAKAQTTPEGEA
jgi:small subunit ribosomal protein S20